MLIWTRHFHLSSCFCVQSPRETPIDNSFPRAFPWLWRGGAFPGKHYAEHSYSFCMKIPPVLETIIGLVYKPASLQRVTNLRTSAWEAVWNRQTIGKVSISIARVSTRLKPYQPTHLLADKRLARDRYSTDIQWDTRPGPTNTRSICRPSARFDRYSADISTDGVDWHYLP